MMIKFLFHVTDFGRSVEIGARWGAFSRLWPRRFRLRRSARDGEDVWRSGKLRVLKRRRAIKTALRLALREDHDPMSLAHKAQRRERCEPPPPIVHVHVEGDDLCPICGELT